MIGVTINSIRDLINSQVKLNITSIVLAPLLFTMEVDNKTFSYRAFRIGGYF